MADAVELVGESRLFAVVVRSLAVRFVSGSMLLSGIFAGIAAFSATTTDAQVSCALASAVALTAAYHYFAIVALRAPKDKPATLAQQAFNETQVDAVRHSDWLATLGALIIDLHVLAGGHTRLFGVGWSVFFLVLMVGFGGFLRFGCDELAPSRSSDWTVQVLGVLSFLGAWICLVLVLLNLLLNLEHEDSDWIYAFSLPWAFYGFIALASIITRQFAPIGYPLALSMFKDVAYGALDVWSKANFALYVGAKALGNLDTVFGF
jgi:hypothetical protein